MICNPNLVSMILTIVLISLFIKQLRTQSLTGSSRLTAVLRMCICTCGRSCQCPENHHMAIITHNVYCIMIPDYYKQQFNYQLNFTTKLFYTRLCDRQPIVHRGTGYPSNQPRGGVTISG